MSVDLVPEWTIGDLRLTSYPFGVDADSSVDIGEPEMVVETVTSMVADGDLERHVRDGNRTYVIPLYVMGATLGELAQAEALLRAEMKKTSLTLTHDPGDGFTPVSVYEVSTAALTPERNDTHESHLVRRYTLTLTCGPFARSAEMVTIEALESGTTTVTVDTCEETTGWSGTRGGVAVAATDFFEADSVHVAELSPQVEAPEQWTLTRTGAVDFSTTPFLVIEVKTISYTAGLRVSAAAGTTPLPVLASRLLADGSGYYRMVFDATGLGTVSSLTFSHTSLPGEPWQGIFVREVSRTNVAPNITARQLTRIIETVGTERTPASIHAFSNYDLADMQVGIVATWPEDGSGYSPSLQRWRVSGNTPTDALGDTLSMKTEALKPASVICEVPNASLPRGGYILAARLTSSVTTLVGIDWAVQTFFPSTTTTNEGVVQGTTPWLPKAVSTYEIVPLAVLTLPTISGVAGKTRVSFRCLASDADVFWDEAFLFRADDDCALTIIDHPASHIWLDSPDVTAPVPRVFEGWGSDRSDNRHPGNRLQAMGNHVLHPQGTAVYAAAITNQLRVAATYFPRWHSNAADPS